MKLKAIKVFTNFLLENKTCKKLFSKDNLFYIIIFLIVSLSQLEFEVEEVSAKYEKKIGTIEIQLIEINKRIDKVYNLLLTWKKNE